MAEKNEDEAYLCIINSNENLKKLTEAYQFNSSKKFKNIFYLKKLSSPIIEKISFKKSTLSNIKKIIYDINPQEIFTGNDRRIEFQYAISLAKKKGECKGIYLDEGLYTYISRSSAHSKESNAYRNFIKKILYGFWWEDTNQMGQSNHIDKQIVFFPEFTNSSKNLTFFPKHFFKSTEFFFLCKKILKHYKLDAKILTSVKILYTLPHEKLLSNNLDHLKFIQKKLKVLPKECILAIKNHPRNKASAAEILSLDNTHINIEPSVPFELLLPYLNHCYIIGDVSSTLLMCRIIRPDLTTISLSSDLADDYDSIGSIFRLMGVLTINQFPTFEELQS